MRVLIPLPARDFDPTETSIPWKLLKEAGHELLFATPDKKPAEADARMLSGEGLGPWRGILRARADARDTYASMRGCDAFKNPLSYGELGSKDLGLDALILPGGHAPGMKLYLESLELQAFVARFFESKKPVGAVCHGNVLAARAKMENTGHSILFGRRVTALPKMMEMSAWAMTCLWLGDYYRTYRESVEGEVLRALGPEGRFEAGPLALRRDSAEHPEYGFTVRDGNLLTARWPGDIYRFSMDFLGMLREL